jgi:uncharacterized protein (TIGR02996 family)
MVGRASVSVPLAAARDAVAADDLGEAVDQLLVAWRHTPAADVAAAIDAVTARACDGVTAPANAAWNRALGELDAARRGALIDAVADTKGHVETLARIDELVALGADPRLSRRVGDLVETPIYNASVTRTSKFWNRVFELLPELGDPRLRARAAGWPAGWARMAKRAPPRADHALNPPEIERMVRRHAKLTPVLAAAYPAVPALADADARACAAVIAALPARSAVPARIEAELLAAIYAAPDDDGPRLVYADYLQQRGDPRGELIALQLAARPTREQRARASQLLAEHGKHWLGPLAAMVKLTGMKFARGFLDSCELKGTWEQVMVDDPGWSTVRALRLGNAGLTQLAALSTPLALEELRWEYREHGSERPYGSDAAVAAFRALRLPRLRRVEIYNVWRERLTPELRARIETAPIVAQLAELTIAVPSPP